MTVKELARAAGVSRQYVYQVKDRIGHMPTLEELQNRDRTKGRPRGDVVPIAEAAGVSRRTVERFREKHGRLPTVEELQKPEP